MGRGYASFDEFVSCALGGTGTPYAYQQRLAERPGGLPELLKAPTGSGKTLSAVLPWLWRLLESPSESASMPHRLVYVLPMRALVEQTHKKVRQWLERLGLGAEVQLHVLMGGEERDDDAWQLHPEQPAIFIGTQDMVLSRALMRGYGEARSRWPVSFGLLHFGTQWVFDETQLMGPALGTSAQLQWLRDKLGAPAQTASMWMSATLDERSLHTPDHKGVLDEVGVEDGDRVGDLAVRLNGRRTVERAQLGDDPKQYASELAGCLTQAHEPGTRTIAVLNTVDRAVKLYEAVRKLAPETDCLLLHSRFRPGERKGLADRLEETVPERGQIVVATQVLEAGVDITSRTLFTEAAPWSCVVQRAGRCNRDGKEPGGGRLLWGVPPRESAAPYASADMEASVAELVGLEGRALTGEELGGREVHQERPVYPVLRRSELLQLFDTTPDLGGADLDVGQWIRDSEERTVFVAWRELSADGPEEKASFPSRDELCPAPVGDVRKLLAGKRPRRMWAYGRLDGGWQRVWPGHVVPGMVLIADAGEGGYDSVLGWAPQEQKAVPPATATSGVGADAVGKDGRSFECGRAVGLAQHLLDVEQQVAATTDALKARLAGVPKNVLEAARLAGLYHDLGKAHWVFQETLRKSMRGEAPVEGLLAKSDGFGGRHRRAYFRHELVSALMLLSSACPLLDGAEERELVTYLAAAHHGKVRMSARSLGEEAHKEPPTVLGVSDSDETLEATLPDGTVVPTVELSLAPLAFAGVAEEGFSWVGMSQGLLQREDLGPFRLAFLEALVRVSDWQVSRSYVGEGAQ